MKTCPKCAAPLRQTTKIYNGVKRIVMKCSQARCGFSHPVARMKAYQFPKKDFKSCCD